MKTERRDIPALNELDDIRRRYALGGSGEVYAKEKDLVTLTVYGDEGLINKTVTVSGNGRKYALVMPSAQKAVFRGLEIGVYTVSQAGSEQGQTIDIAFYGAYAVTLRSGNVYGVEIDLSGSSPLNSVKYTDEAVGMNAGDSAFDDFFGARACLFKNGAVVCYLDPNNFAKKADGSAADITSGASGDVMIEFPRRDISITKTGSKINVRITNGLGKTGYSHYAHKRGGADKDAFYLGAYFGNILYSRLTSLSGVTPQGNLLWSSARNAARSNGSGYEIMAFYQLTYLQVLYLIKYKNLNSQSAVGQGYVNASSAASTGNTKERGMCYGTSSASQQMKLFGLEDMWGNMRALIDGIYHDGNTVYTATDNFSDSGADYQKAGVWTAGDSWQSYFKDCYATDEMGFLASEYGGSASTYFCDSSNLTSGYGNLASTLNDRACGDYCGIFNIALTGKSDATHSTLGARLMYL